MTKKYTLLSSDVEDEQKTIVVSEDVTIKNEEKLTIAQLKERHAQKIEQIERLKEEADNIVDQLESINNDTNLDLVVKNIPSKLIN